MTSTQRVLVPLDGSALAEQAIPFAKAVAGSEGKLTFMHVVPEPEPLRGLFGSVLATADDVLNMERETAAALIVETADRWKDVLGEEPSIHVAPGDPAEMILHAARTLEATMIVIASHGRGVAGRLAFGSVADRIARSSRVPVLIVHPAETEAPDYTVVRIGRIVVPLDGSEVALEALPVAAMLSEACGAPVHLVSAVNPSALMLPSPVGASYYPAELYEEISDEMTKSAREALAAAEQAIGADAIEVTQSVVEGSPVSAIESQMQTGDLIVMTSHGRGGFQRWLLGSVSERLIRSGIAPVVLVPAAARVAAGTDQG